MRFRGFSLIEVLVTVAVISLAIGPLVQLMSTSNRMSNASIYEVMAVHYAAEVTEQLQWLAQNNTIANIRSATGKDLQDILTDPATNAVMETPPIPNEPYMAVLPSTEIRLLLSPLHPNFTSRRLYVRRLDSTMATTLKFGTYWDVSVGLRWRFAPGDIEHGATFSTILRE